VREVLQLVFSCFDSQIKVMRQTTYTKVDSEIKKLEKKGLQQVCDHLSVILAELLDSHLRSFRQKAGQLVIEHSGWESKIDAHSLQLSDGLRTLAENCKAKMLEQLKQTAQHDNEIRLKALVHEQMAGLSA
jgi:hypothetical protein